MRSRSFRRSPARSFVESSLVASILAVSMLGACGSDDKDPGGDPSTEGGQTGNEGGSGNDTGRGGRGGSTSGGASNEGGAGGGTDRGDDVFDEGEDGPGYDGIDADEATVTDLPGGCADGYDPDSQVLEITLDADVPLVVLGVSKGVLTANGNACASADDDPANLEALTTIRVTGGREDNAVFVDGGADFGPTLLAVDAGIELSLGAGENRLILLGSDGPDHIQLGNDGESILADFSGDLEPDVRALSVTTVLVSSGPKPDVVSADGGALELDAVAVPVRLFGGGNNDRLTGGAADDELFGGIGNDTLVAGQDAGGADRYYGGTGEDLVDYSDRAAGVIVTLDGTADDGEAGEKDNLDPSVEDVRGGAGPNEITGNALGNRLWGGASADIILGGDGSDFIFGEGGDDDLDGEGGDDFVYGDEGDDDIRGGDGDDSLEGYPGKNKLDGGPGDGDICLIRSTDKGSGCEL